GRWLPWIAGTPEPRDPGPGNALRTGEPAPDPGGDPRLSHHRIDVGAGLSAAGSRRAGLVHAAARVPGSRAAGISPHLLQLRHADHAGLRRYHAAAPPGPQPRRTGGAHRAAVPGD